VAVVAALVLGTAGWLGRAALSTASVWVGERVREGTARVEGWATKLRRLSATVPSREAEARTGPSGSLSALVVVGSGPGDCAFALLAQSPEGEDTVTLLPQDLLGVVPGYGEFTLAEALAFEGPNLAALTVVNVLGVRLDWVLALAPGDLALALPASVPVDLPVPLFVERDGRTVNVLASGAQQVPPASVESLLVTEGVGDDFEWLQRQGAAWRGILATVAADPAVADRLAAFSPAGTGEVGGLLTALATADDLVVGSPPVEPAAAGGALVLSPEAATVFVPQRLGHLLLRTGDRPRVEVLNGNGRIGATRVVAEALVRRGFLLVRTDNADRFDYRTTVVIAEGSEAVPAAQEAAGVIGAGSVYVEEAAPSQVVDVSIIVGLDIPAGEA
jgi:hypothetical protein